MTTRGRRTGSADRRTGSVRPVLVIAGIGLAVVIGAVGAIIVWRLLRRTTAAEADVEGHATRPVGGSDPSIGGQFHGMPIGAAPAGRRTVRIVLLWGIVVVAVLAVAASCVVFAPRDDDRASATPGAAATSSASVPRRQTQPDQTARNGIDSRPPTLHKIFGSPLGTFDDDAGFRMVRWETATDCRAAAVPQLAAVLQAERCQQLVRATMLAADDGLALTAGVLTFTGSKSVQRVTTVLRGPTTRGYFRPLPAPGADAFSLGQPLIGQAKVLGNHVLYVVIGRVAGGSIGDSGGKASAAGTTVLDVMSGRLATHS